MVTHSIAATQHAPFVAQKMDELRDVTGQIVGSVFYGSMLKAARNSSLKGSVGHGGRGEEVFGAQLDQVLAERMGRADRQRGVAAELYRRLEAQQQRIARSRLEHQEHAR